MAVESLIADEGRVSGDAIETVFRSIRPIEEIDGVDSCVWNMSGCRGHGGTVPIDSDHVGMSRQKPAVAAGRIQQTVGGRPNDPPHEPVCDLRRRIE